MCNDVDFECAKLIIDTLSENSHEVYELLMKNKEDKQNTLSTASFEQKAQMVKRAIELYHQGYSHSQIALEVLGNAALKGTIHKWLKKAGLTGKKK